MLNITIYIFRYLLANKIKEPERWVRQQLLFSVNNISIIVASPQFVTMTTSCCSRLEEVNGVVIMSHLL